MKVTKSILKEMIESEIVNERIGQRVDILRNAVQVRKLQTAVDNKNKSKFDRWWRNEFANIDQADIKDANHGAALNKAIKGAIALGWLPTGFLSSLSAGRTSAGLSTSARLSTPEEKSTPVQTSKASKSDISILDYLDEGRSVLKVGSSGSKVLALQSIINARLQSHGKQDKLIEVTGTFDSATKKAVIALQKVYNTQIDGIVGRQTWVAIKSDGAVNAAVTLRAETVPSSGSAETEEAEEAAIEAAIGPARSGERPDQPGPMFSWDSQKLVWYAFYNHYYFNYDKDPIYQLWIVKDNVDYHIKMDPEYTWDDVLQSDIDELGDNDEQTSEEVEESYSIAKTMLVENEKFVFVASGKEENPNNTSRQVVGRIKIETLEEQKVFIDTKLKTFSLAVQELGRKLKIEADKPFYVNSDESKTLDTLNKFNELAKTLYTDTSANAIKFLSLGGRLEGLVTPSYVLAKAGGWKSVEDMIGTEWSNGLDSFLSREEFGAMSNIVRRNDFLIIEKERVVVARSNDPDNANQEEVKLVNTNLNGGEDSLITMITPLALIIATQSYDPNDQAGWLVAQTAAAALAAIVTVAFAVPAVAGAVTTGLEATVASLSLGSGILAATNTGLGVGTSALGGAAMTGVGLTGAGGAATAASATLAPVAVGPTASAALVGSSTSAGLAAGTAVLGGGSLATLAAAFSFFGDGAEESLVMSQLEIFEEHALRFYQNNAKLIVDNDMKVKTPSQYLVDIYNDNVNTDDMTNNADGLIDKLDEFLAFGNLSNASSILKMNDKSYSDFVNDMNESFSFDRFQKLAGLLKG